MLSRAADHATHCRTYTVSLPEAALRIASKSATDDTIWMALSAMMTEMNQAVQENAAHVQNCRYRLLFVTDNMLWTAALCGRMGDYATRRV
jgi:hypothetical protein